MTGQGFKEVFNLKGGIKAWNGLKAVGPEEAGMAFLPSDMSIEAVIQLAFGMEEGLRTFYAYLAEKKEDPGLSDLLSELSRFEKAHKEVIFKIYLRSVPDPKDRSDFEAGIDSNMMEGGFTTEEFLAKNAEALSSSQDVLTLAMMLETQALDLYMRYSQKMPDSESEAVFQELAEDEKKHLAMLGGMMDRSVQDESTEKAQ
jgi:rubrerythrin